MLHLQDGGSGCLILGSVDSYGHLIVSKLDNSDVDRLTFSALPRDCGVGEGGWAGLCFSPSQWSTAAVTRSFCKSIEVCDQDIHFQTIHTLQELYRNICSFSFSRV
ncbi:Abnormal embryogenesis protein [Actinidia chinensis var. chinensis]|uniref:Abnormal embryogenesis protein n=1 Tax=Actinidia chinensis var. chinensis TaxID=1590841 RepID=A0A2R6RNV7_ACTCC|nr:Abnormal embryogenesis protein [Actinidia chinensis var. chinensis]